MKIQHEITTTADRTFLSLCYEIDDLKEAVAYWKDKYEEVVAERNAEWAERSKQTLQDVGNALRFALSVTDDIDGNLVISKEDRINLAKNWKK